MSNAQLLYVLLEALKQWKCPACGGKGTYLNRGFRRDHQPVETGPQLIKGKFYNESIPCTKCQGKGLHPIAQEALTKAGVDL